MKIAIAVLFCLVLMSCGTGYETHCLVADKVAMNFVKEVEKTDGLVVTGSGGAMMGDIQEIFLSFETDRCLDKAEMRSFLTQKSERFIELINENEEIRPYLHDYPCTEKNIELWVIFHKNGKKNLKYPHVRSAQLIRGKIYYSEFADEEDWFITESAEKYEDAFKILCAEEKDSG